MNTRSTARVTGTFWLVPGPVLILASVVLAVSAANESQRLVERRSSMCDGTIPMPISAFVLGWAAVVVALLATVAVVLGRCWRDPVPLSHMLYDSWRTFLGVIAVVALLVAAVTAVWTAAFAGVVAIVTIAVVTSRHRPGSGTTSDTQRPRAARSLYIVFLAAAALALLFNSFVLYAVYGDAPAMAHLCSG